MTIQQPNEPARQRGRPATGRKSTRNMTVDSDVLDILHGVADKMQVKLGFRPTLSQTIRHLSKRKDSLS